MLGYLLAILSGILWGVSTPLMKIYSPQNKANHQKAFEDICSSNSKRKNKSRKDKTLSNIKSITEKESESVIELKNKKASAAADVKESSGLISNSFTFLASLTSNWKVCLFVFALIFAFMWERKWKAVE